jgi:hypothetical protein
MSRSTGTSAQRFCHGPSPFGIFSSRCSFSSGDSVSFLKQAPLELHFRVSGDNASAIRGVAKDRMECSNNKIGFVIVLVVVGKIVSQHSFSMAAELVGVNSWTAGRWVNPNPTAS